MLSSFLTKPILIAAAAALCWAVCAARADVPCTIQVKGEIEVSGSAVSLADLLAGAACPAMRQAASRVRLGSVPLPGSVRVLDGAEVRGMLEKITAFVEDRVSVRVPERVSVRRAGGRASCNDISARMDSQKCNCGMAGRIPLGAPLVFSRPVWDRSLAHWKFVARCTRPGDCVPFLVEVAGLTPEAEAAATQAPQKSQVITAAESIAAASGELLVHSGQMATLLWDQDGIRMRLRAICLERGALGDVIRARVVPRGRVLRATVISGGGLRAGS